MRRAVNLALAMAAALLLLVTAFPPPITLQLDAPGFAKEEGLAWLVDLSSRQPRFTDLRSDVPAAPTRSSARIFENGRLLGPGHTVHEDIRRNGGGRYSHWQESLYLSTSDGSDPRTNGRRYEMKVGVALSSRIVVPAFAVLLASLLAFNWRALRRDLSAEGGAGAGDPGVLVFVAGAAAPPLAIAALACAGAFMLAKQPVNVRGPSPEHAIVDVQIGRTLSPGRFDVAFVGDSSCLMGIDAARLEARLAPAKVENFCTLGYVGPAGYAHQVENLRLRDARPEATLVLMIHGVQLPRTADWETWADYVRKDARVAPQPGNPVDTARFALWNSLSPWVFSLLPGAYGRHYGSESGLREVVARDAVVDPRDRQLPASAIVPPFVPSLERLAEKRTRGSVEQPFRYEANGRFIDAAAVLRRSVAPIRERTFVVLSPIPYSVEDDTTASGREHVARQVADLFGIAHDHVLATPGALPSEWFATTTHLNPLGRTAFSELLAQRLRDRLRPQGGPAMPVRGP